jgi:hypothetical protein
MRVGQFTRGKLCLEGFVSAVHAVQCADQWPGAASSRFERGSNSPVQFAPYASCAHLPAPVAATAARKGMTFVAAVTLAVWS